MIQLLSVRRRCLVGENTRTHITQVTTTPERVEVNKSRESRHANERIANRSTQKIFTLLDLSGLFIALRLGLALELQQDGMNSPSASDAPSSSHSPSSSSATVSNVLSSATTEEEFSQSMLHTNFHHLSSYPFWRSESDLRASPKLRALHRLLFPFCSSDYSPGRT